MQGFDNKPGYAARGRAAQSGRAVRPGGMDESPQVPAAAVDLGVSGRAAGGRAACPGSGECPAGGAQSPKVAAFPPGGHGWCGAAPGASRLWATRAVSVGGLGSVARVAGRPFAADLGLGWGR
jgi:hypothetical protein